MNIGCLSSFTPNHSTHAQRWLLKGNQITVVCVACLVEIIENKNEPSVKKTKTLHELLQLVSNGTVLSILAENEDFLSHLLKCLIELMDYKNTQRAQSITIVEIVNQLCCALKSEIFVNNVVDKLESKILSTENVKKIFPQMDLLGKLVQNNPALVGNLIRGHVKLVNHLSKLTSFPDEAARSSLFFILTYFYRHPGYSSGIPSELTYLVFRECCEVLTTATSKELQINSIALLQSLTSKTNMSFLSKAVTSNTDLIITCLKKAFLSTIDLVQTLAISCLNNLVEYDESIIISDLPGFLFEVFSSKSDTVLLMGMQCVFKFLDRKQMFTKGHIVYGFDAMLSALLTATDTKNMKVLIKGFEVLSKTFEQSPRELVLITNRNALDKCLDVITKGLSACDDNVFLRAAWCFAVVLDTFTQHDPCDLPYGRLRVLVELVLKKLQQVCHSGVDWSRAENKDLKSPTVAVTLQVINKCVDLVIVERAKPPSVEALLASKEESITHDLEEFFANFLRLCDQICIPNVIANLRIIDNMAASETFFKVLNKLLQTCSDEAEGMAKKFVSSCFVQIALETKSRYLGKDSSTRLLETINGFLVTISCLLLPENMQDYSSSLFSSSLQRVNGTAQELLQVLKQNNSQDEMLRNTQETILILFYLAYSNGDLLTPRAQLLHALSTFLVLNPRCHLDSPMVTLRVLIQLYLTVLHESRAESSSLYTNAQRLLGAGMLENMDTLSVLYFHDIAILDWAVTFQDLDPELRKGIMELWFSHESETNVKEQELMFWRRAVNRNPRTLLMLVSLLCTADHHAQHSLLEVIQHVVEFCKMVKDVLSDLKHALHKLFLNQAVEPLPKQNIESILQLLCLLAVSCVKAPLDEDCIKLVYHVVNFLTNQANSPRLCVKCLNILNSYTIQDTRYGSHKIISFLLNHQEYNRFLEQVIDAYPNSGQLDRNQQDSILAAVLVSISQLLQLQHNFGISSKNVRISVRIETVLPLLCQNLNPLLQFAANIFWESVLRFIERGKLFCSNVILFSEENNAAYGADGSYKTLTQDNNPEGRNQNISLELSIVHFRMILAFLQNSLLRANMLVKLTALRCLEALFTVQKHATELIKDPWNMAILCEGKDTDSTTALAFTMRLYSLFLQKQSMPEQPIKDLVKEVIEQSNNNEGKEANQLPDLYLSALPRFFIEVISKANPDSITEADKEKLKNHVQRLVASYHSSNNEEHEEHLVYVQEILIHDEMIHGRISNIQRSLNELLAKLL